MLIIPAIDIIDGKCVRLTKGNFQGKVYEFGDPVQIAIKWEKKGAKYLHIIDLDGAKKGSVQNLDIVKGIGNATNLKIQLGGGIRTLEEAEKAFQTGVSRIIIGTKAIEDTQLLKRLIKKFGSERIMVSVDMRKGKICGKGWQEEYEKDVGEFLRELEIIECKRVLLTSIDRDGLMKGPDLELLRNIGNGTKMKIILAGGISTKEDVEKIKQNKLTEGIVIGKALYIEKIKLEEVIG